MNSGSLRDPSFLLSDPQDFRVITHRADDDWLDLTVRDMLAYGHIGLNVSLGGYDGGVVCESLIIIAAGRLVNIETGVVFETYIFWC